LRRTSAIPTRLSSKGAPQHRPLGHALEESRAARDRDRLLALLLPVQRAADKSALVREMVQRGDIYHPLRWTAREAHAFLKEVPALEAAGVVVRVPDWWNARTPPRPQIKVTVGGRPPSQLGTDAVLDFSVQVALDGEPLSPDERRAILQATDGLRACRPAPAAGRDRSRTAPPPARCRRERSASHSPAWPPR